VSGKKREKKREEEMIKRAKIITDTLTLVIKATEKLEQYKD